MVSVTITDQRGNDFGCRSEDPGVVIDYLAWYVEQNTKGSVTIDNNAGATPLFPIPTQAAAQVHNDYPH